jgi:membrane-bound metal-dependent hydrolase YbcI (DUF457 family)
MDTITHGIAGALIGKALFGGDDLFTSRDMNRARLITWATMLGAIFPDSDVFRDLVSRDPLLIITWHRSITHSLVLLPLWALLLAWITRAFANSRKWNPPSFAGLFGICAVGLLSHILLDLVTSFGTMIWSPLRWSRPAWDLIFIVDFTLTGIFLLPQMLAWAYSDEKTAKTRAFAVWLVFAPAPYLIGRIGENVGAPISATAIAVATMLLTALFLVPVMHGLGKRVAYANWSRAGLLASVIYIALAVYAHHKAFVRIQHFANLDRLEVQAIGALPLPPSLLKWDGLVRTPRGVYQLRMDLSNRLAGDDAVLAQEHHYFPDAFQNPYIDQTMKLPEVQKVLWFSRFPLTRFHMEGDEAIVEISDVRFRPLRRDRPASFTYRVRFAHDGTVVSKGWVTR